MFAYQHERACVFKADSERLLGLSLVADQCVTQEGSDAAAESQLYLTEALQRQVQKTHRHNPHLFGALLLMVPELRTLSHLSANTLSTRLEQFLDIKDALSPLMKETLSPIGKGYELLSDEMVKIICRAEPLMEHAQLNREKKQRLKLKKAKKARGAVDHTNVQFFKPPSVNQDKYVFSLRADVFHDETEETVDSQTEHEPVMHDGLVNVRM